MIKNHFKIAWRNVLRHKGFSFLNIAGLAIGFTACFLIALFVWDEHQFDDFLPEGERVYRVVNQYTDNEGTELIASAPPMYATSLKNNFPEVEQTARILMLQGNRFLFEAGEKEIYEGNGIFVDSTFFQVFPLPFSYGSSSTALSEPASIALSEEMATRFFGEEDPVGKELMMNNPPLKVSGVFQKNPKFHLDFDYVLPLSLYGIPAARMQSWGWQQFYNYVKLKKGADAEALEKKFQIYADEKTREFDETSQSSNLPFFQPLEDIHLHSASFKYDNAIRGNITYVRALLNR